MPVLDERRGSHPIPAPPRPATPSYVYALAGGDRVKFGRSTDPERRLRDLQASSPVPLGVLARCPGGSVAERLIHRYLEGWRCHGEWYANVPEVAAVATAMRQVDELATSYDYARADLVDLLTRAVELHSRGYVHIPSTPPVDGR